MRVEGKQSRFSLSCLLQPFIASISLFELIFFLSSPFLRFSLFFPFSSQTASVCSALHSLRIDAFAVFFRLCPTASDSFLFQTPFFSYFLSVTLSFLPILFPLPSFFPYILFFNIFSSVNLIWSAETRVKLKAREQRKFGEKGSEK